MKAKKDADETVITRYNLADTIYSKAEVDCSQGIVNLWLGANVMLEYTYDEALDLLTSKQSAAQNDYKEVRVVQILFVQYFIDTSFIVHALIAHSLPPLSFR